MDTLPIWLNEIIKNNRNGMDVDKLDYIARDDFHCRANTSCHTQLAPNILESLKIIETEINGKEDQTLAFDISKVLTVWRYSEKRFENYKEIYYHNEVTSVQLMFRDVLLEADPYYNFVDRLIDHDPVKFLQLTDSIFPSISKKKGENRLKKSREILERIKWRDLYLFANEVIIEDDEQRKQFDEESVAAQSEDLYPSDILIFKFKLNYGCGEENPIKNQYFYDPMNPETIIQLDEDEKW